MSGRALESVIRLSAIEPSGRQPVYNLTVEGEHEFYANGVLVHNCDALRYLCGPFTAPEQDLRPSEVESRMGDERTFGQSSDVDPSQSGIPSAW